VFEDSDGTMLSPATLAPYLGPLGLPPAFPAGAAWAGATLHSGVGNDLLDPSECGYLRGPAAFPTANNAVVCAPSAGTFRRLYVSTSAPAELTGVRAVTSCAPLWLGWGKGAGAG
jgi:hypothetical protein